MQILNDINWSNIADVVSVITNFSHQSPLLRTTTMGKGGGGMNTVNSLVINMVDWKVILINYEISNSPDHQNLNFHIILSHKLIKLFPSWCILVLVYDHTCDLICVYRWDTCLVFGLHISSGSHKIFCPLSVGTLK